MEVKIAECSRDARGSALKFYESLAFYNDINYID